jgi:AcrR family transcriptional regulator
VTTAPQPRPLRADAARNRQSLLKAAATAFAEHGTDVSVAEIAQRAGIGKGTVFRHFATKEQLLAAILCDQLDELTATGTALLEADDPAAALREFMTAGVALQARDRSFCEVTAIAREDVEVRAAGDRLSDTAEALTAQARRQGSVREDVTGQDIVLLLRGAYQAAAPFIDTAPELWRRYLALIFDGLRPGADQLPPAAATRK